MKGLMFTLSEMNLGNHSKLDQTKIGKSVPGQHVVSELKWTDDLQF